jgi:CHAT domain-containing protein/tetratricopeptide (TPR) repeat protein
MTRPAPLTHRIAIFLAVIVVVLLSASSGTFRDDRRLRLSNPGGTPLQLLPDDRLVEAYRSIGYVTTLTSQTPLDSLLCSMLGRKETPTLRYIASEVMRYARLTGKAFHTTSADSLYSVVLRTPESRLLYYRLSQRQRWLYDNMYKRGTPAAGVVDSIQADLADFKRLDLESWTGYDYETCAAYYQSIDDDERANACLQKALASHLANGDVYLASKVYGDIGRQFLRAGDWFNAEDDFVQSLQLANETGDQSIMSRALYWLARFRAAEGYPVVAESLLVRSMTNGGGRADPSTEANELLALGELYIEQRNFARAGAMLERAILRIRRDLADPAIAANRNHKYFLMVYLATAMSDEAAIQSAAGELDAAAGSIRAALRIGDETHDEGLRAELMSKLGDIESTAGRPRDALRSYMSALAIARRRHDQASEAKYARVVGETCTRLGRFGEADARFAEALERSRSSRSWAERVDILHSMARSRIARGDYAAAGGFLNRAVAALEAGLAQARFAESVAATGRRLDAICADMIALESDHFGRVDSLIYLAELSRQLRDPADRLDTGRLRARLRSCLEHRGWIPERALVIEHLVTPEKAIVIAIDRKGETFQPIPVAASRLRARTAGFVAACMAASATEGSAGAPRYAAIADSARSLYRLLFGPIGPLLDGKDVLCLIPGEALCGLPFGALIPPGEEPRLLVEEKQIILSPALLDLESRTVAGSGPAAARPSGRYPSVLLIGQSEISPFIGRLYPSLDSLPQARLEIAEIRRLVPAARVLLGRSATKDSVAVLLGTADLVHIAAHAVRFPAYQGEAALVLTAPAAGPDSDNVGSSLLTETEIEAMKLERTELAVVSSCESAVGGRSVQARGFGIGGAFYAAGARAVAATLWPVEDSDARLFAGAFYADLMRGADDPAGAMRRATIRMIREDRSGGNALRRICVWGPFILLGSF